MAEMSAYCKAYEAKSFHDYPGWNPNLAALRIETKEVDGEDVEVPRDGLQDDDILYLHDNYTVTDGVFNDEHVVFDAVTDDWKSFCHEKLAFEIQHYEPIEIKVETTPTESASAS